MNIELKENIWKSDESALGFYCVNIFECSEKNPELSKMLQNRILKEIDFGPIETMRKSVKEPTDYYGSVLLNQISALDFKKLNFDGLKSEIQEYWKDDDWGDDLPIFKKNFDLAISELTGLDLEARDFYYLNAEKLESDKIDDPNFYIYLVCIISTKPESNEIITLTFGLD